LSGAELGFLQTRHFFTPIWHALGIVAFHYRPNTYLTLPLVLPLEFSLDDSFTSDDASFSLLVCRIWRRVFLYVSPIFPFTRPSAPQRASARLSAPQAANFFLNEPSRLV
jgi:hypothetical protein